MDEIWSDYRLTKVISEENLENIKGCDENNPEGLSYRYESMVNDKNEDTREWKMEPEPLGLARKANRKVYMAEKSK